MFEQPATHEGKRLSALRKESDIRREILYTLSRRELKYCGCAGAECDRDLLGDSFTHLYVIATPALRKEFNLIEPVAGRLLGQPYCDKCLAEILATPPSKRNPKFNSDRAQSELMVLAAARMTACCLPKQPAWKGIKEPRVCAVHLPKRAGVHPE